MIYETKKRILRMIAIANVMIGSVWIFSLAAFTILEKLQNVSASANGTAVILTERQQAIVILAVGVLQILAGIAVLCSWGDRVIRISAAMFCIAATVAGFIAILNGYPMVYFGNTNLSVLYLVLVFMPDNTRTEKYITA